MKRIELEESDSTFIYYTLRQYAKSNGFDREDEANILELANKFKTN